MCVFLCEFLSFCLYNEFLCVAGMCMSVCVCLCVLQSIFFEREHNSEIRSEYSLRLTLIIPPACLAHAFRNYVGQKLQICPTYLNSSTEVPASLARCASGECFNFRISSLAVHDLSVCICAQFCFVFYFYHVFCFCSFFKETLMDLFFCV